MDVHPPHGSIRTWRDFFVHLIIISLGLLIALGLEGVVEWMHNRHLVHTAYANLKSELLENRATLANDQKSLDAAQRELEEDLALLSAFRASHRANGEPKFYWEWNGLKAAAWDTARNTGAVALMDYETAQKYSDTYAQESLVNLQASAYVRNIYRSGAPLQRDRHLAALQPAEVDAMTANLQQAIADLIYLRDLSAGLSRDFEHTASSE
jgi:hypothetical protein